MPNEREKTLEAMRAMVIEQAKHDPKIQTVITDVMEVFARAELNVAEVVSVIEILKEQIMARPTVRERMAKPQDLGAGMKAATETFCELPDPQAIMGIMEDDE